eukprot:6007263-Pyramimonas_sp.AAC.1
MFFVWSAPRVRDGGGAAESDSGVHGQLRRRGGRARGRDSGRPGPDADENDEETYEGEPISVAALEDLGLGYSHAT